MRSLRWIDMMFIMSQASGGKYEWSANYPNNISTTKGANVTIPCNFSCPKGPSDKSVQAYWKKISGQNLNIPDHDKNEFIYHPNKTLVSESFQDRTELIGDISKGNCSLKIKTIIGNGDIGPFYLRISNGANNFSFYNQKVRINISGYNQSLVSLTDTDNFTSTLTPPTLPEDKSSTKIYIAIIVPLVAVVLLAALGNVWFFKYRKRSRPVILQDSVYYANITTKTPGPEIVKTTEKKDNTQVPPPKIIDEPIYGNVESPQNTMDRMDEPMNMDSMDNVYANVDFANR